MKRYLLLMLFWSVLQCSTLETELINLRSALQRLGNQLVSYTEDAIRFGPGEVLYAKGIPKKELAYEVRTWLEKFYVANMPFLKTNPESFKTYAALDQAFKHAGKILYQNSTKELFKVLDILWQIISDEMIDQLIDSLNSREYDVRQIADLYYRLLELKATNDFKDEWSKTRLNDQELKKLGQAIQVRESMKKEQL